MEAIDKISLTQKSLPSGNIQVKFYIEDERKPMYGYLLTQEPKSVGEIIEEIQERMQHRRKVLSGLQSMLPVNANKEDNNFYLFSA